jgi:cytochrome c oxidase cbb3-type subunit 2
MPGFPFLFTEKAPNAVRPGDVVVVIPGPRAPRGRVVVAKPEALALADYLLSLKHNAPVPTSAAARERTAGPLAGGMSRHDGTASTAP